MNKIKNKKPILAVLVSVICIAAVIFFVTVLNNETTQSTNVDYGKNLTEIDQTIYQPMEVQTTQIPYQTMVTEVRTLPDCIKSPHSSEVTPCTLINLQIKNNNVRSLEFKLVKEDIIGKSSTMFQKRYENNVGLNNLCTPQAGMEFVLTENTQRNIGLCHPTINYAEEPTLKVEALINEVSILNQMELI